MFRSNDIGVLRNQIDRFDLPIFVAQRSEMSGEFEFLALNLACERQTGVAMQDIVLKPLEKIFPRAQAKRIQSRYALCVEQAPPLRYRETLDLPCGLIAWETTLHHVLTNNGEHRVVGSATQFSKVYRDALDIAAFQDVRYYSSFSGWKLDQIIQVLDAYDQGAIPNAQLSATMQALSGLCRSVASSMQHLRSTADDRLRTSAERTFDQIGDTDTAQSPSEVEKAMSAIMDMFDPSQVNVKA